MTIYLDPAERLELEKEMNGGPEQEEEEERSVLDKSGLPEKGREMELTAEDIDKMLDDQAMDEDFEGWRSSPAC